MKQKKVKVHYRSTDSMDKSNPVPMLQVTGHWLEKLGFSIGDTIIMEYDETSIRFRPMTAEEKVEQKKLDLEKEIKCRTAELEQIKKHADDEISHLSYVAEGKGSYNTSRSSS